MNFLIHGAGSHGDILPLIAIGRELKTRGHSVHFFIDPYFIKHSQNAGLDSIPVSDGFWAAMQKNPQIYHPLKIHHIISEGCVAYAEMALPTMKAHMDTPQTTVTICNKLAYAARLLSELEGCPNVTIHYAPYSVRSSINPPRYLPHMIKLPQFANKAYWYILDVFFIDPVYTSRLNVLRKKLGLQPVRRMFDHWMYDTDVQLGMFPAWFAETQPDWPVHFQKTGFPLFDAGDGTLPEAVQAFLDAGEKPIAFTAGTFNTSADDFFEVSAEACRKLGKRAILVSPSQEKISKSLPPEIAHFSYVPFGALMPHLAAFVHHGGVGTLAQAMAAGVPQLIRPMFGDQFDNAQRLIDIGIAREVLSSDYKVDNVARALKELVDNPAYKENAVRYADKLRGENGVGAACDALLQKVGL